MCSNELADGYGQSRLNFDILHLICNDLTEIADIFSFSLTCSTLREGALQRRLRISPVVLTRPDSVERFHRFIFANPASRAPYIYGLVLAPTDATGFAPNDDSQAQVINCLATILEAATHLEYLWLATAIGHPVCPAVAKLTRLRKLVVVSDARSQHAQHKPEALDGVLTTLRSPLRHLIIRDYEMGQISASFLHNSLRHFSSTLEILSVEVFNFNISPSSVTTPFTALRSLRIDSFDQPHFYQLDVLLRLFPHLDTLFLLGVLPEPDEFPPLRGQSMAAQKEHTWLGLEHAFLSTELVYLMALRCPIRCMDILNGPVLWRMAPYLTDALRDNCPPHLMLPIEFTNPDNLQHLRGLLPSQAVDKLTHLVLFVEVNVTRRRRRPSGCECFDWDLLLDNLIDFVKPLRLTHLRIAFEYCIYPLARDPWDPECDCDEDFTRNVAQDTDLQPAAVRLLDAVQTLRYVFLTTCGTPRYGRSWHSSKAYQRVVMAPGGDVMDPDGRLSDMERGSELCVEISHDAAEAVFDKEKLHFGEREQTSPFRSCDGGTWS